MSAAGGKRVSYLLVKRSFVAAAAAAAAATAAVAAVAGAAAAATGAAGCAGVVVLRKSWKESWLLLYSWNLLLCCRSQSASNILHFVP